MKSKGKKKEELDALQKELSDAKNLFVAQFQGMTVAQDTELRQKIHPTLPRRKCKGMRQRHEHQPGDWQYQDHRDEGIAGATQAHAAAEIEAVEELVARGEP